MHDATTTAIGTRHGIMTVIADAGSRMTGEGRGRGYVVCRCDCGNLKTIMRKRLIDDAFKHKISNCGCLTAKKREEKRIEKQREIAKAREGRASIVAENAKRRHLRALCRKRLLGMIRRCTDTKHSRYAGYGAKGVKVCELWTNDHNAFIDWALSHGFRPDLEIDRIDNNGDYCPENCRWITRAENVARIDKTKRKGATVIEWNGERMTARAWERKLGLKRSTIGWRIRHGYNTHDALFGRRRAG